MHIPAYSNVFRLEIYVVFIYALIMLKRPVLSDVKSLENTVVDL